jgi:serine/threonine protein kinase
MNWKASDFNYFKHLYAESKSTHPVRVKRGEVTFQGRVIDLVVKEYEKTCLDNHENEIETMKFISNKHHTFIQYYDSFTENDSVFILMEFWEKGLNHFMTSLSKHPNSVTEEDLHSIVNSLIDGFSYLESLSIYHHDIKPQNILINQTLQVKIIDFNLAIRLPKPEEKGKKSKYPSSGTRKFMSPEVLQLHVTGQKEGLYNLGLSDVYSLGLVFLILLAKINPENLPNLQNLEVLSNNLRKINDKFYYDLVKNMLEQNPDDRKTFKELREMIDLKIFYLPLGFLCDFQEFKNVQSCRMIKEGFYSYYPSFHQGMAQVLFFAEGLYEQGLRCANLMCKACKIAGDSWFHAAFEKERCIYIVITPTMTSLRQFIRMKNHDESRFSMEEIFYYVKKIVDYLIMLWNQGIFHYEITSESILITSSGVILVGYSLPLGVRVKKSSDSLKEAQKSPYIAPELLMCLENQDFSFYDYEKAEVYSLGIVLYEMYSLLPPDSIKINRKSVMTNLILSRFNDSLSPYLRQMLDPDPCNRISISELHRYLNH